MSRHAAGDTRSRLGRAIGLFVMLRMGELLAALVILAVANMLAPINPHFGPWISAYSILLWEYAFWQYGLVSVVAWILYFAVSRLRVRALPVALFNAVLHPAFVAAWQWQYNGTGKGFGDTLWYSAMALAVFDFVLAFVLVRWRERRRAGRIFSP